MIIKWSNIAVLAFALIALCVICTHGNEIRAFLANMTRIGPGHSNDEVTAGLIAFGLVGVIIVAIVRLLTNSHGGPHP